MARKIDIVSKPLRTGVLFLLATVFLIPFYVLLRNSSATDAFLLAKRFALWPLPSRLFHNFRELLTSGSVNVLSGLRVSAIAATSGVVLQLIVASLCGFALARIPYRYKRQILIGILFTMMIPTQAIIVPLFILCLRLGWVNTYAGLIFPAVFGCFATFLYRQSFLDFPQALEDAGKIDGLGYFGLYFYLAMPTTKGTTIALSVILFFQKWNEFLWPLIIGQNREMWTIQVVIASFTGGYISVLHLMYIGALVALLPLIVLFFWLQKYIVQGIALSAIKG